MKALKVLLPALLIISLVAVSMSNVPVVQAQDNKPVILIDISHGSYHTEFTHFAGNWTEKGFNVTILSNPNVSIADMLNDNVKALLLPGNKVNYTATELAAIKSWFEQGHRLLWVAGDSDYGGHFNSNSALNPLLAYLGANLRLSTDAVDDTQSNDGASYRVIANETGTDPVAKLLTRNVTRAVFHGPTSVLGWNNGPVDLRNTTINGANISVVMKSSAAAKAIDQDVSYNPTYDYYTYSTNITGYYPMLVVQFMSNSMLVVSGEANFADYKNMYSTITEHGDPQDGKILVDNIMTYALITSAPTSNLSSTTSPTTGGGFLPAPSFYLLAISLFSLATIVVLRRKR